MAIPLPFRVHAAVYAACTLFLAACSESPGFRSEASIEANPNPRVPLAAVLSFEVGAPATTLIDLSDGKHSWRLEFGPEYGLAEGLAIMGMRPNRIHKIRMALCIADGDEIQASRVLKFTTPAPPPAEVSA